MEETTPGHEGLMDTTEKVLATYMVLLIIFCIIMALFWHWGIAAVFLVVWAIISPDRLSRFYEVPTEDK
jgi:hypothetical protein